MKPVQNSTTNSGTVGPHTILVNVTIILVHVLCNDLVSRLSFILFCVCIYTDVLLYTGFLDFFLHIPFLMPISG